MQGKIELSALRLLKARECLNDSRLLMENGGYKSSMNRSYYAVFHSLRAVLVFSDYDSKKHSGIISEFRRIHIKNGDFSEQLSKIIGSQFDLRSLSDYDDFFSASEETAEKCFDEARYVLSEIEKFLSEKYKVE